MNRAMLPREGDVSVSAETTKLDFEGAILNHSFSCSNTKITSLEGAPSHVGHSFYCNNVAISSLHNIHKIIKYIGDQFYLPSTIKSHVLGLMYIEGLKKIEFDGIMIREYGLGSAAVILKRELVATIINKHLKGDRDIHACQEEMLEAGLVEYARL